MRPGAGKQKGGAFERLCCRQLSAWVSNGTQDDVFWRSAMSGGRSTVAAIKGKRLAMQAGDISCIAPAGQIFANKFFVEAKFYKKLDFIGLITNTGNLAGFWSIAKKEAAYYKKVPFLVAKQNHQPAVICTNEIGVHLLRARPLVVCEAPPLELILIPLAELLAVKYEETRLPYYDYARALRDFRSHQHQAVGRSIEFLFTFEEWVVWWESQLGLKWQALRGNRKGQYVMARNGDIGPYAPWNVKCITQDENASERATNGTAARGVNVNTNKLSEAQVIDIYYDARSLKELAKEYGVDTTMIWLIKRRRAWKWLLNSLPAKRPT
jgi:hypothetical protein